MVVASVSPGLRATQFSLIAKCVCRAGDVPDDRARSGAAQRPARTRTSVSTGARACRGRETWVGASARDCLLGPIDQQALVPEIEKKQGRRLSASRCRRPTSPRVSTLANCETVAVLSVSPASPVMRASARTQATGSIDSQAGPGRGRRARPSLAALGCRLSDHEHARRLGRSDRGGCLATAEGLTRREPGAPQDPHRTAFRRPASLVVRSRAVSPVLAAPEHYSTA